VVETVDTENGWRKMNANNVSVKFFRSVDGSSCADFRLSISVFEPVTVINLENVTLRNIVEHHRVAVTQATFKNGTFCNIVSHERLGVTNQITRNVTFCNIVEHALPKVARQSLENGTLCNMR